MATLVLQANSSDYVYLLLQTGDEYMDSPTFRIKLFVFHHHCLFVTQ